MGDRLAGSLVPASGTIRDALAAIDRGGAGIALATDEGGRLLGVVTDGDLRRAILRGAELDSPVGPVLVRDFVAIRRGQTRADALDLMVARRIDVIPVLDDADRPLALHLLHGFVEPVARDNWAVVMAGGRGARLAPLTDSLPKPMLRVAGRPILERIVLHLVGHGITRIFLSVNYLAQVIEAHFGNGEAFGARIEYLREATPLGTAGALGLLPAVPDRAIVLLNGDLVTNVDVGELLDRHERGGYAATVGTRRYVHTVPFGCVDRDGDRVIGLEEKPDIEREVNAGIYALGTGALRLVGRGEALGMPDLIARLLDRGEPVGAFEVEDDWVDVGHRDELLRAQEGS